ncbi:MAG: hypothetical protein JWN86_4468 [Planctomycetota bacterium]|nr:hypothetical protein [Planctomycetota bacterium]
MKSDLPERIGRADPLHPQTQMNADRISIYDAGFSGNLLTRHHPVRDVVTIGAEKGDE